MNKDTFHISYNQDQQIEKEIIILQLGKGKKAYEKIVLNKTVFSYIEGIIWDKYREYRNTKIQKIASTDWIRIIDGLESSLESIKNGIPLKTALKFNMSTPKNNLNDMETLKDELKIFMTHILDWLKANIDKEKFIYLLKD